MFIFLENEKEKEEKISMCGGCAKRIATLKCADCMPSGIYLFYSILFFFIFVVLILF